MYVLSVLHMTYLSAAAWNAAAGIAVQASLVQFVQIQPHSTFVDMGPYMSQCLCIPIPQIRQ